MNFVPHVRQLFLLSVETQPFVIDSTKLESRTREQASLFTHDVRINIWLLTGFLRYRLLFIVLISFSCWIFYGRKRKCMVKQEPNSFFALWPKGFTQNDPVHYQTREILLIQWGSIIKVLTETPKKVPPKELFCNTWVDSEHQTAF